VAPADLGVSAAKAINLNLSNGEAEALATYAENITMKAGSALTAAALAKKISAWR
jgi:hypothetical protein